MRVVLTRSIFSQTLLVIVMACFYVSLAAASETAGQDPSIAELPKADDLSALAASSRKEHLPILLMYSAEDCDYCEQLESEVLRPMMISGELKNKVIFRKIDVDDVVAIKDFRGKSIDPEKFAFSKGIEVTPTLQFVDAKGDELAPKIIGYGGSELFSAYLDSAIEGSREKLVKR